MFFLLDLDFGVGSPAARIAKALELLRGRERKEGGRGTEKRTEIDRTVHEIPIARLAKRLAVTLLHYRSGTLNSSSQNCVCMLTNHTHTDPYRSAYTLSAQL